MWPPTMYYDICQSVLNDTKKLDLARRVFRDYKEKKCTFLISFFLFKIFYHEITKKFLNLKGSWLMINEERGSINRAYCTCVAKRGQSFLHVAEFFMKVDLTGKFGLKNPAFTFLECSCLCKPHLANAPEKNM